MKYAKYIKELFFIVLFVSLSVTTIDNIRTIRQLRINIEQTKNNLYQTNQVIAEMQKQVYESNLIVNQTGN
tara:strand:+ start:3860 stop:4072 length:213 start_codon:yes stop_codon:yes gene_type:complete